MTQHYTILFPKLHLQAEHLQRFQIKETHKKKGGQKFIPNLIQTPKQQINSLRGIILSLNL